MMLTMPIFWVMATDSINGSIVDKHSEAYIRQRIDTIYKFVGKITYDAEGTHELGCLLTAGG